MKLDELKKQQEKILAEAEKLGKQIEQLENDEWPKEGDDYWFISNYGSVYSYRFDRCFVDKNRQITGNMYRTKEEAKTALKIIRRIAELRGDWKPDFNDMEQLKFEIYYELIKNKFDYINCKSYLTIGGVFLPTEGAAQTLIDEFGDDLFLIMNRI